MNVMLPRPEAEKTHAKPALAPPLALLAELTHRCPLACPYCSNPVEMARAGQELGTPGWRRVIDQAAALGVLQIHFSGGEPLVRRDLEELVSHSAKAGLYTNLITSAVMLDQARLDALVAAGLDHVQISVQDAEPKSAERIGGMKGAHAKKMAAAARVRAAGLPLTLNAVVHRQNLDRLEQMIELALACDADRLEVAHVQYYGWALKNRAALMPTRAQLDRATEVVNAARAELKGRLVIDYVVPDYYAHRPKACMGGWGQRFITVSPAGKVLPCHAAEVIPDMRFDSVEEESLATIWAEGEAFQRFRGTSWMPELCRSCEHKERDWGGCRCQALALTGDAAATDPACAKSPHHAELVNVAERESAGDAPEFVYRRFS
ncbi:pyrroloquinoline quinone biosynthesis protein PqqE [Indioceanicola profundi]|uniref:pyrroloquinoline quinone biosynthesis protein PqqE n=1 Tax=Indioceanicola profundi TaxID=2220096 RepID=UPI001968D500|nr:pyrroloquinoline quinone biosynthesis protein PqqE [Indioceanicola profundi]